MKKIKWISGLLILVMMIGLMAGCGTDNNQTSSDTSSDSQSNDNESSDSTDNITLHYLTWSGAGQREADERAVAKFNEENTGIEVKDEYVPESDYLSKLNTLVAADTPPDIAFLNEYLVHDWGAKGILADLTSYFENDSDISLDDFIEGAAFVSDEKVWGVTPGVEIIMMFFNKEIFDQAGVEYPSQDPMNPWTWDEFTEAAKKLTVDINGNGPESPEFNQNAVKTYGTLAPTFWLQNMPLLYSNNASYASDDGTSLAIDSPEGIEVLQSIADLIYEHRVAPTPAIQEGMPSSAQMLIDGQLAMLIDGQWSVSIFGEEEFYDVGIAPLPMFEKPANITWGSSVVIFEKTEHKSEAFKFVKHYINPESGLQVSAEGSWMPNMIKWFTEPDLLSRWTDNERHNEDFLNVVPKIVTDVSSIPENVTLKNFGPIVDQTISPELDKLWLGEMTAEEVVEGMEDKVKEELIGVWE